MDLGDVKSSESEPYTEYFVVVIMIIKILTLLFNILGHIGVKKEWKSADNLKVISKNCFFVGNVALAILLILYFHPLSKNIVVTGKVKTFIFTMALAMIAANISSLFKIGD